MNLIRCCFATLREADLPAWIHDSKILQESSWSLVAQFGKFHLGHIDAWA